MQWLVASLESCKARLRDTIRRNRKTSKGVLLLGYKGFGDNFRAALERIGFAVDFRETAKLWEISDLTSFDVVVINWAEIQLRFSGDLAADVLKVRDCLERVKSARVPVVWVVHNILPHDLAEENRAAYELLNHTFISASDLVISMNSVEHQRLQQLGCSSETLLPLFHPNYLDEFEGLLWSKETARQKLAIPSSAFMYIVVGYLRPYKGVLEIVEAFKEIRQDNDLLYVVGHDLDKAYATQIRSHSDEGIKVIPRFVSREELSLHLAAADAVIMNHAEAINSNTGALALAQSFGKPVICPHHGSFRELTSPESALLFSSHVGLTEHIRAIKSRNLRTMGEASFALVADKSWDAFVAALQARLFERWGIQPCAQGRVVDRM